MRRLLLLVLLAPTVAHAHHNKGLPHYGYFENYPQVPTEEYVVVQGDWEFGGTVFNFQGLDRRSSDTPNDVKLYLYVYDLAGDGPYSGPAEFEVRLDGERVVGFSRQSPDQESIYVSRETLPASGTYEIEVTLLGASPPAKVTLEFDIDLADGADWAVVLGIAAPVLLVFALALLGRTRRGRARLQKARAGAPAAIVGGVDCADPGSVAAAIADGNTHASHVMSGMPPLMFAVGVALLIVVTFLVVEWRRPGDARPWRRNLIRRRAVYETVKSRWFQAIPQLIAVAALVGLVYAGLAGSRVRNVTPVAVWTVWWAGLVFVVALAGPLFCWACPWDGLSNLASRLRVAARVEPLSLALPVPEALRNMYPAIAAFVLLSWAELGLGTTTDPRQTAYLGLGMAGMAVMCALLFDGKAFCRYGCPVGRISGLYGTFSPVEVRARNPRACGTCETEDCLTGNELGYACPVGISLKTIGDETASACTMCTECVKTCRRYNVALNLRPFGSGLHGAVKPRADEAWLALTLLALTLFHGLTMTTTWENPLPGEWSLMKWMTVTLGTGSAFNFTVGMALSMAIPVGLYGLSCRVAAWWTRDSGVSATEIFRRYAFALLPVALFYHLAHNSMHLVMEGGHLVPLLSDPLGHGSDLLGTAGVRVGHLMGEQTLWWLQLALILVGHVFGLVVAHRISRRLFPRASDALRSLVPVTALMVLVSVAGLTLMVMDMHMRLGRA